MKRTKKHDTRQCDWCKRNGKKARATWQHNGQYACDSHKEKIHIDDGYMTEADYQSWYRL